MQAWDATRGAFATEKADRPSPEAVGLVRRISHAEPVSGPRRLPALSPRLSQARGHSRSAGLSGAGCALPRLLAIVNPT